MRTLRTFTGRTIDPINLQPDDIDIHDIAHSLSQICRFNGHSSVFYSVAAHSIYVSRLCPAADRMAGLLHDASEAYLCDILRPLKEAPEFEQYRLIEKRVQAAIYNKFGLPGDVPEAVHEADKAMLVAEGIQLMHTIYSGFGKPADVAVKHLSPRRVEKAFLSEYMSLLYDEISLLQAFTQTRLH